MVNRAGNVHPGEVVPKNADGAKPGNSIRLCVYAGKNPLKKDDYYLNVQACVVDREKKNVHVKMYCFRISLKKEEILKEAVERDRCGTCQIDPPTSPTSSPFDVTGTYSIGTYTVTCVLVNNDDGTTVRPVPGSMHYDTSLQTPTWGCKFSTGSGSYTINANVNCSPAPQGSDSKSVVVS